VEVAILYGSRCMWSRRCYCCRYSVVLIVDPHRLSIEGDHHPDDEGGKAQKHYNCVDNPDRDAFIPRSRVQVTLVLPLRLLRFVVAINIVLGVYFGLNPFSRFRFTRFRYSR